MNDKKLLELAAKAAGIELVTWGKPLKFAIKESTPLQMWNPLTDDGDALRMAVKLMNFEPYASRGTVPFIKNDTVATRHAIVRAAAEIGKTK